MNIHKAYLRILCIYGIEYNILCGEPLEEYVHDLCVFFLVEILITEHVDWAQHCKFTFWILWKKNQNQLKTLYFSNSIFVLQSLDTLCFEIFTLYIFIFLYVFL